MALGPNHPSYAGTLANVAALLAKMGRYRESTARSLEAVEVQWRSLTQNLPTLTDRQKTQLLAGQDIGAAEMLWSIVFHENGLDSAAGASGALMAKQVSFEATRQESAALRDVFVRASSEWQKAFHERQQFRRQYATLVLQGVSDTRQPQSDESVSPDYVRKLGARIENLEQELRQTNPQYAQLARLERVTLADVQKALSPADAVIEYVHYKRYDFDADSSGNEHYGAFVVRQGHVVAVDLGEANKIDDSVHAFRSEVLKNLGSWKAAHPSKRQVREAEAAAAELSSALWARVWQPLEKHLKGVGRVYVAPDGMLGLIPFEALAKQSPEGGWRYLVEEHELVYVGTGRDLARLAMTTKRQAKGSRTAVLIGNPDFNAEPRELAKVVTGLHAKKPRTAVAQGEAAPEGATVGPTGSEPVRSSEIRRDWKPYKELKDLVDAAFKQLKGLGWSVPPVLSDETAVEEAVYGLKSPRILQFATHGYLLGPKKEGEAGWDNPLLRSTLMMAGVNKQPERAAFYRVDNDVMTKAQADGRGLSQAQLDQARIQLADGVLTAYEVTGLDLTNTEFVNLTACETGLGEVTSEGVVGLRQAFLLAGARSLTTSMWEIPAAETIQQIQDFYGRWLGGKGTQGTARYKAFRAAQLEALKRARDTNGGGHPFYWAGVVFVGDPGDLPRVRKR